MDTYLNIFNHHQFNVFLLILIMYFEFRAITEERLVYSFLGGVCFSLVVASRMGSITAITTLFLYLLWYALSDIKAKELGKHIGIAFLGTALMGGVLYVLLRVTGHLIYFKNNISRLFSLASGESGGGGYQFDSLMRGFITGNLKAVASGAIYLAV